jgi:hypothetical protein
MAKAADFVEVEGARGAPTGGTGGYIGAEFLVETVGADGEVLGLEGCRELGHRAPGGLEVVGCLCW